MVGKASTTLVRLTSRVWSIPKFTVKTKMAVYNACVLSTLLCGSETWATYARQEKKHLFAASWACPGKTSDQRWSPVSCWPSHRLHLAETTPACLGHVCRMEDGRIPKDILYGELATGQRNTGRPHLRFKDVCKRDMRALDRRGFMKSNRKFNVSLDGTFLSHTTNLNSSSYLPLCEFVESEHFQFPFLMPWPRLFKHWIGLSTG